MIIFIIYNLTLEIDSEVESIKRQCEKVYQKNLAVSSFLQGLKDGSNESTKNELQKFIGGAEELKYQGISVIKRKDCKTWCARFRKNGKQYYVSAKTQLECYEKLKKALKSKNKEEVKRIATKQPSKIKQNKITLADWYIKWLKLYKKDVKERTIKDYKISLEYLKPILKKPLSEITSIEILEILNEITHERRKQLVYELLKALYDKAVINEVTEKNIMLRIDKPKHKRKNGTALTNFDEKELEEILIQNHADMFLVCLYQGLRRGEMLALTSDDIDLNNKTLRISKSLNQKNEIDTTKNIYSNRVMPLFDKTAEILKNYKNVSGRIFDVSYLTCERRFRELTKLLKNKYTIHSLRHTFITRCQEANIPLHIIQKWVGHVQGSEVTNKVYTHSRTVAEAENIKHYNDLFK